MIFLSIWILEIVCRAAYSFDKSSLASQEDQEQINETFGPFSQHWQIKSFSCWFVFPFTLIYSFDLKGHMFYLITYFLAVLRIQPRASRTLAKPLTLVLNVSINFFQRGENKIHQQAILILEG